MAQGYPTEWEKFCNIEKIHGGFTNYKLNAGTTIGHLNRFSARYFARLRSINEVINHCEAALSCQKKRINT